jgi:hypothetical protein
VAPGEVEEALLSHPAVAQAVAFALPDARLGEDVGAAVVLRKGASTSEMALRQHVGGRLADVKVPRRVLFIQAIPRTGSGKPLRIGLAARLGLDRPEALQAPAELVPPRTPTERAVAAVWRDVLGPREIGVENGFIELGGDSILAVRLARHLHERWGLELSPLALFDGSSTIARQAELIEAAREGLPSGMRGEHADG